VHAAVEQYEDQCHGDDPLHQLRRQRAKRRVDVGRNGGEDEEHGRGWHPQQIGQPA